MASLLEQAGNAASQWVKEQFCSGAGYLLNNLPAVGPGGRAARETARGIHGAICGLPTPPELGEPTQSPPQYTGGQCEGVLYTVTVDFTRVNIVNCTQFTGSFAAGGIPGPVGSFSLGPPKSVTCDPSIGGRNGILRNGQSFYPEPSNTATLSITAVSVERGDGLPDECGDPPPDGPPIPPPPAPPIPTPPDIDLPVTPPSGGGPDVNLTFSPRVGPIFIGVGGGLFIPVNVRVNGPTINVNAPVSIPVNISLPDFNINFPGQGGGGGAPDDPSAPIPPGGGDRPLPGPPRVVCCAPPLEPGPEIDEDDGDEPPETPEGRRLIGVLIRCSIISSAQNVTEVGQGGGELNLYVPRLANIYFTVAADNLAGLPQAASSEALPVQLLRQFIPAPEGVFIRTWRAVAEPGISVVATPLYVPANRV